MEVKDKAIYTSHKIFYVMNVVVFHQKNRLKSDEMITKNLYAYKFFWDTR